MLLDRILKIGQYKKVELDEKIVYIRTYTMWRFSKIKFFNCIKLFIEREQNVQKTLNYGIVEFIRKCNFHGMTFKYFHLIMSEINLIVMISYPSKKWIFKIPKMQFGEYIENYGLQGL